MNEKIGLILTSSSWGGLEMNVLKLAKLLASKGKEVHFFQIEGSHIAREISKTSVCTHNVTPHRKYFDITGAYKFSRLLHDLSIHNLIVFDNRDLDFVFFTKLFLHNKLKVIYQQHMQIGIPKKDLLHTIRFSSIDYWLTPLESLKKEIGLKTRYNLQKVKVVPLGTDIQRFISTKYTKSEAREKLGLKKTSFLIGIIGRIDPKKGQLFLIEAIHKLREQFGQVELLIVGEPTFQDAMCEDYLSHIKEYIIKNNLSESIYIRGFTNDVNLFYSAIDLFALASENETYGMVTIESILSGVPVIATNSAGTPEILDYGKFGHLYTPFDIQAFCKIVSEIMAHFQQTAKMAVKARKNAIQKYSQDSECASILQLIR